MGKRRRSSKRATGGAHNDDEDGDGGSSSGVTGHTADDELRSMMVVEVDNEDDLDEESDGEGGFVTRSDPGSRIGADEDDEEDLDDGDDDEEEDDEEADEDDEDEDEEEEEEEDGGSNEHSNSLSASLAAARAQKEQQSGAAEGGRSKPSKFDVPTMGEQRALRSAGDLLRSNLLVLQAQALLQEAVALPHEDDLHASRGGLGGGDDDDENGNDDDGIGAGGGGSGKRSDSSSSAEALRRATKAQRAEQEALTAWLFGLRSWLLGLPKANISGEDACRACPGLPLSNHGRAAIQHARFVAAASSSAASVPIATPEPAPSLAFHAPAKVDVVGDFMLRTVRKSPVTGTMAVDVLVTMPEECLGPRDHVNARYLDKRHLYLAVIANYLVRGQAAAAAAHAADPSSGAKKTKKGAPKREDSSSKASACPPLLRGGVEGVRFTAPRGGDARKCSLLLRPCQLAGRRFVVRLGVCLAPNSLVAARLQPGRSNLRRYWPVDPAVPAAAKAALMEQARQASAGNSSARMSDDGSGSSSSNRDEKSKKAAAAAARAAAVAEDASLGMPATPHYNSLVLEDLACAQRRTKLLHAALSRPSSSSSSSLDCSSEGGCPGLRGAMVLARCWLAARHQGGGLGYDALDGEQLDAVLLYLFRAKKTIGPRMGSLQCFTLLLHFLASSGLTRNGPLAFPPMDDEDDEDDDDDGEDDEDDDDRRGDSSKGQRKEKKQKLNAWGFPAGVPISPEELATYSAHFEVSLVDPVTRLNWLSSVSGSGAAEMAREAAASVAWLQASDRGGAESATDAFEAVFLKRTPFVARHDAYVAVPFVSPGNEVLNTFLGGPGGAGAGSGKDKNSKKKSEGSKKKGKVADSALDRELCATLDLPPGQWLSRALPRLLGKALGDRHTLCVARCHEHWVTRATGGACGGGVKAEAGAAAAGRAAAGEGGASAMGNTTTAPSWRLGDASIFGSDNSSGSRMSSSNSGFSGVVVLGLDLDASQATRMVDRGPPADDPIAAPAFRHFWGERAELRRFKDGAIVEAVIWQEAASNSGSQKSASGVVEAIVKFTLDRHSPSFALRAPSPSPFSTASSSSSPRSGLVHFVGSQLEDVLLGTDGAPGGGDYLASVRSALSSLQDLDSRLKVVSGAAKAMVNDAVTGRPLYARRGGGLSAVLPLKVEALHPVDPCLRYTSLLPPIPTGYLGSKLVEPLEVVVKLERSSAWPNDLRALRAAKTAFLVQICRALGEYAPGNKGGPAAAAASSSTSNNKHSTKKKQKRDLQHGEGEDSALKVECFPYEAYADVILNGFVFRLRLAVDLEVSLIPFHPYTMGAAQAAQLASKEKSGGGSSNSKSSGRNGRKGKGGKAVVAGGGGGGGGVGMGKQIVEQKGHVFADLTACGYGDLTPHAAWAAARGQALPSPREQRLAATWGSIAPVAERWREHVATWVLPRHHSLVHGCAMRHRAYSASVRLAHRWLASHRLAHQIPVAAVELLVAHAFWYGRGEATTAAVATSATTTGSGGGSGGDGQYSSTGAWGGAFAVPGTAAAGKKVNQRLAAAGGSYGGSSGGLGYPDGVPSTAFHGLHRFLLLLASHDFQNSPVVVEPEPYAKSNDNNLSSAADDDNDDDDGSPNDDTSAVYGQGAADVSKRSTKALSSSDRRAIRTAFETARESSSHAGAAGASALAAGGRVRASAMWVVAPYDRAHGWLSSWGVCHGSSPATDHGGFPSVAPTAAQRSSADSSSSGAHGGVPLGLGGCGSGVVLSNGFEGPDDAALGQVVQTAKESLAHLHAWVRAAGRQATDEAAGDEEPARAHVGGGSGAASAASSWEAAFTPAEAHHSLGAAVALRVCPKTVAAAAEAGHEEDGQSMSGRSSSSCVSGVTLLSGHCHGPASSLLRIKPYKNAGTAAKKSHRSSSGGASMVFSGSSSSNTSGPFSGVSASERLVGLRPLELAVAELRARFGHLAIFYTDAVGPASFACNGSGSSSSGPCVYVAWRPAWLEPQPFRVLESAFRRLEPPVAASGAKKSSAGRNSDDDDEDSDTNDNDDETDPFSPTAGQGSSATMATPKKASAVGDPLALVSAMLACTSGVLDRAKFF